ncbi:hypothetical protein G3I34_03640 [Streptomyces sp. SID8014]|uniref:hypothetical protein n=1 Tax=Streptomyces sp. SID8014 TaxID=2706097 RepID=UPI0013B7E56F|nr:hypothetical protein [Streptomyces sp. SID8014]NEC11417.1 hypothetical protein [Streptomyces sp. SID8014]
MNTGVRIGLYAAGLVVAFGAAYGVGVQFGPEPDRPAPAEHGGHPRDTGGDHREDHGAAPPASATPR